MTKLEKLLIPLFAAVLIGALLLEDLSPDAVRRLALGFGAFLALFLVAGFVIRYVRHRRLTADLKRRESENR
jgi:uncharacterized membrane protein YfcA